MRIAVILSLIILPSSLYPSASAGEIAELHKKLAKGQQKISDSSRSHEQVESKDHGIAEIGLERTRCFGTCPAYTVVIKSDGTFRYHGGTFVSREGDHTRKVKVYELNELCQFIKDVRYMELDHTYYRPVTDQPTAYTTVVMNGKRQIIENYANAGPTKLWAIEQLIDKLLCDAEWDSPKGK